MTDDMGWARSLPLHERLLIARRRAGFSQVEMADILGVNRGTISEWENAHSMLPADKLLAWADACNAWWMVRSPAQCV